MAPRKHEFRVTLPAADADDVDLTIEDNFAVFEEADIQEKRPVVILLGWAGCVDKHLAKYSEIYEKRRLITIRHIFPTDALFFNFGLLKPIARKVLDVIFEQKLEDHQIVFHIFSNGGCFIYCHIIDFLHSQERYNQLQVKGCIIDSAPGKRRVMKAAQAFMATLRMNIILKYILGFCIMIYLFFSRFIGQFLGKDKGSGNPFFLYESICEDKGRYPQLFLFSRKDHVILHEDVQEVVDRRKQHGVDVWSVCWEDSDHVAHFRVHREAYIQKCHEFVSHCLQLQNPS
ncbi:transmembrane protein 53-like [Haliotis asinina]|uniref:transmembrane protein 53-like n=1 Tax=Haliotis asinina TaxID=109174 RepID=UPI003532408A